MPNTLTGPNKLPLFLGVSSANLIIGMGGTQIAWGIFNGTISLFLLGARRSSALIYGDTQFENYYNRQIENYIYFVMGALFVVAVKFVRNAYSVIAVLLASVLSLLQLAMKIKYTHNFYNDPLKYNVCGKYHLFGKINYRNSTIFPITTEELMAEKVLLTMRTGVECAFTVFLVVVSSFHTRFVLNRFCGVNTIDPSQHKERKASYQPPPLPQDYVEIEELM